MPGALQTAGWCSEAGCRAVRAPQRGRRQAACQRRAARRTQRACAGLAGTPLQRGRSNGGRLWAGQWLENSAQTDVAAPLEQCFRMWENRERIPQWMPWIQSVKAGAPGRAWPRWTRGTAPGSAALWRQVQPEDAALSKWVLSTHQFGREWRISWLARNLTPVRNQKIHWRSVPVRLRPSGPAMRLQLLLLCQPQHMEAPVVLQGSTEAPIEVANRGIIRFYPASAAACSVKLTISYEVCLVGWWCRMLVAEAKAARPLLRWAAPEPTWTLLPRCQTCWPLWLEP